jgi:dCMP deaminase
MKQKYVDLYMDWAERCAQLSHARRLQVGAVIVKDDSVISYGYNGMPAGWDNNCEYKEYCLSKDFNGNYFPGTEKEYPLEDDFGRYRLKTKSEVLHAESNAVAKLARSANSGSGADIFVTHSPCIDCAKLIYQSGVKRVWFNNAYRDDSGIDFLKKSGVEVTQIQKGA